MNTRLLKLVSPWFAVVTLLAAGPVHAELLNKSFTAESFLDTALSGTTSAARPELAGLVLEDTSTSFSFGGLSGHVQSRVVRQTVAGTLDFSWRVFIDPDPAGLIGGITALRLGGFGYDNIYDADWRSDGLGSVAVATGRVFNPASYPDGSINFLFDAPVGAEGIGAESRFFFLHTDATNYALTAQYDLLCSTGSGCISELFTTYAPAAPIPEPEIYAMMGLGLGLLGWVGRRRKQKEAATV